MDSFNEYLKDYLINTIPRAKVVSGGKEVLIRCPFCMDSKDPRSAHFYISIGNPNIPPMYFCQKCQESGIVDGRLLRKFDIYDSDITSMVNDNAKKILSKPGNKIYRSNGIHRIYNTITYDPRLANIKANYINNRLGLDLSIEEMMSRKIVLNLYDILDQNRITQLTRHQNITDILHSYFVGFLSYDNGFINMRNTLKPGDIKYKDLDKRYINYNIFNNADNSKRHYVIPTQVDILKPVEVHIAEGPFDILGILYHLYNGDTNQKIYSSIGGRSYINLVKFFVEELGIINMILHIYVDGDVDSYEVDNIIRYLSGLNVEINIHRNTYPGEKDYGVPKDKIIDTIVKTTRRVF